MADADFTLAPRRPPMDGYAEEAAPADLTGKAARADEMPPEMMMQLRELGLL